jgi:hypothetical protein
MRPVNATLDSASEPEGFFSSATRMTDEAKSATLAAIGRAQAKVGDKEGARASLDKGHRRPFAADQDRTTVQSGRLFGWYDPGTLRKLMAIRFQALIAATAQVRSTSSFSVNCCLTSA